MDTDKIKNNYILIPGWAVDELKLKGNDLIIFSIIYGFSQDGESRFHGGLKYLCKWTGCSKQCVIKNLQNLVSNGFIIKYENIINNVKFCEYSVPDINELRLKFTSGKQNLPAMSSELEEIDGGGKQNLTGGKQSLPNNINNNIINISTSKSNKLDLSVDTGSNEPSEYYNSSFENNSGVSVYGKTEDNTNNVPGTAMPETFKVDISKEQNEVDKINALKILKRDKSKKSNKNNKDTPFHKCVNIINSRPNYSKQLKDLLYKYLQFRITCTHSDPTAWEVLLDSLDNLVSSSITNDINELNYLKEQIVLKSLQCEYRKFYPMSDIEVAKHLTQYRESIRDCKTDLEGLEIHSHGKVDTSVLATNDDGTPMIF